MRKFLVIPGKALSSWTWKLETVTTNNKFFKTFTQSSAYKKVLILWSITKL